MAGFGDNTTVFQRVTVIGPGGMKMEAGCWTGGTGSTLAIPTTFTQVYAVICTTTSLAEAPCVSSGCIKGTASLTASGKIVNYVAFGC